MTLSSIVLLLACAVQAAPELTVQTGHWLSVDAVALSQNGRIAATGGKDGQAMLWDVATGFKLRAVHADSLGVVAVSLSRDGRRMLTGGAGTAVLWDSTNGKALRRFGDPGEFLAAAVLSPDAKTVLTAGGDGCARLWDAATGKRQRQICSGAAKLTGASWSPNGRHLALAAGGDELWVVDAHTGAITATLSGGGPWISVALSADGRLLASSREDAVRVWDIATGREKAEFKASAGRGLSFSPDGRSLMSVGGNTARLWTTAGEPLAALIGHSDAVRAAVISADGASALTGSDDHSARLWSLPQGRQRRRLADERAAIKRCLVSPDGSRLVTIDDRSARLWETNTGRLLTLSTGDYSSASDFSLSRDGGLLAYIRDREMIDLKDLAHGRDLGTFRWNLLRASAVAMDPAGRFLAAANEERIQLWDVETMKERLDAPQPTARVDRLWIGLWGRRLLYVDGYGALHLWDLERRRAVNDWPARGASLPEVILSPDTMLFASAERSSGRAVWSIRSLDDGKLLRGWDTNPGATPLSFGGDGQTLLIGDAASAWIWDAAASHIQASLELPSGVKLGWPQTAEPSWRFALAEAAGAVSILSLKSGKELGRLSLYEDGWMINDNNGHFDASPQQARWTVDLTSFPLERFAGKRLERGLLRRLLSAQP